MKLATNNKGFDGLVPESRIPFTIKANAKLFSILSDGIYKDKILAVIRELSCNAYDAHIAAGQTKPFKVIVPTKLDPTFTVIDEGTGIDPAKIADIYWTYGESSKTDTNDQIGALGLGSKSPFAYTQSSFIVKNRYNGQEHTYFCFINENGTPDGSEVSVEPTDLPNGITVEVAVRTEDIKAFRDRIIEFFSYWDPKDLPEFSDSTLVLEKMKPILEADDWIVFEGSSYSRFSNTAVAIMGNVPYPISASAIPNISDAAMMICNSRIAIRCPMGSLNFQASREELSYDNATVAQIESIAARIITEIYAKVTEKIVDGVKTPLELANNCLHYKRYFSEIVFRNMERTFGPFVKNDEIFQLNGKSYTGRDLLYPGIIVESKEKPTTNFKLIDNRSQYTRKLINAWRFYYTRPHETLKNPDGTPMLQQNILPFQRPGAEKQKVRVTRKPNEITNAAQATAQGYTFSHAKLELYLSTRNCSTRFTPEMVTFVLNDQGSNGHALMSYNVGAGRFARDHLIVYVEQDRDHTTPDLGLAEVQAMLAESVLEGANIVKLSEIPNFTKPYKEEKEPEPKVTHPKLSMEVRIATHTGHSTENHSRSITLFNTTYLPKKFYGESDLTRVQPQGLEMLVAQTYRGKIVDHVESRYYDQLDWLIACGVFDSRLGTTQSSRFNGNKPTPQLNIIMANEGDIETLKRRGAKLTSLKAHVDEYFVKHGFVKLAADAHSKLQIINELRVDKPACTALLATLMHSDSLFGKAFGGLKLYSEINAAAIEGYNQSYKRVTSTVPKWFKALCLSRCLPSTFNLEGMTGVRSVIANVMDTYPLLFSGSSLTVDRANLAHATMYINGVDAKLKQEAIDAAYKAAQLCFNFTEPEVISGEDVTIESPYCLAA